MTEEALFKNISNVLLTQDFPVKNVQDPIFELIEMLKAYMKIENCVAVLSDYQSDKSHIFSGPFGRFFDIEDQFITINSAFEEFIFQRFYKEDLLKRHQLEVDYMHFLRNIAVNRRAEYNTECILRASTPENNVQFVKHQMRYIKHMDNGAFWLSLCLYTPTDKPINYMGFQGFIFNNLTGKNIVNSSKNKAMLTSRESDVLTLVSKGFLSKQIADQLEISINTVNRHRQNIIRKMKVSHIAEAIALIK